MDGSHLLHPNLLRNEELIAHIKEKLAVSNLDQLSRIELMELFKKHIMPKPQRQRKGSSTSQLQDVGAVASTNNLANEVKRIKLSQSTPVSNHQVQFDDRRDCNMKRNQEDHRDDSSNRNKRQRIQWP